MELGEVLGRLSFFFFFLNIFLRYSMFFIRGDREYSIRFQSFLIFPSIVGLDKFFEERCINCIWTAFRILDV